MTRTITHDVHRRFIPSCLHLAPNTVKSLIVDVVDDATQTLANVYLALENDLEIIPILNKIDLPAADPDRVKEEIEETIGLDCSNIGEFASRAEYVSLLDDRLLLRLSYVQ